MQVLKVKQMKNSLNIFNTMAHILLKMKKMFSEISHKSLATQDLVHKCCIQEIIYF
jgi:hypothetical protein